MNPSEKAQPPLESHQMQPLRFLLVEDDPDQVELMTVLITDYFSKSTLTVARTVADARANDFSTFDLGLFDMQLPDGTGIELLKYVRSRCELPVIMVTGERFGAIAAESIRTGAMDYVVKHGDYLNVLPVVIEKALTMVEIRAFNQRLERELLARNAELERLNKQLREMASNDALTGLYNRRHFGELLHQLFSESQRYQTDLTCLMLDLDNFKNVNDTLGHPVGDGVLQLTAEVLRTVLRQSDLPARYGGDEFIVLLPRTGLAEARATARRLVACFAEHVAGRMPKVLGVSLSIGLASRGQGQTTNGEALVRLADQALYLAKSAGKGRIMEVAPQEVIVDR